MKKLFLITSFLLLCVVVQAQTFVCTDVDYSGAPEKQQREKTLLLGSKATLAIFDRSIKITTVDNRGSSETFVLDKTNDNEYQYSEYKQKHKWRMVIKLHKWAAYIKSLTIEVYKDYSLQGKATYKRD